MGVVAGKGDLIPAGAGVMGSGRRMAGFFPVLRMACVNALRDWVLHEVC